MTKGDRWIGIALIVFGAFMLYQAFTMEFPVFPNDPGPVLMPKILGIGLLICGAGLLVWPKSEAAEAKRKEESKFDEGSKRMAVIGSALILYIFLMKFIGFLISTVLFMAFVIWFLDDAKSKKTVVLSVVSSIIVSGGIYLIFNNGLGIILP